MNFIQELKSKKTTILTSAPLDGVSDFAFCKICLDGGADIVFTEMTSVNDLYYKSKKLIAYLNQFKGLKNVVIQLYGKEADKFEKAAKIAEEIGFSGIDINFGCPAKNVISNGGGVMLMRDLDNVYKIIENTLKGTSLPVSIKIRAGISVESIKKHQLKISDDTLNFLENKEIITALDLLKKIKSLPISMLTIHGRTFEQLFSGDIDYDLLRKCNKYIKKEFKSNPLLIVNGGIINKATMENALTKTGFDGAMIGRGSYGKPFVFNEIKGINYDFKDFILKHAQYLFESKPNKAHLDFRKHLLWYLKDANNFNDVKSEIVKIQSVDDIKNILNKIKNDPTL